MANIAIFLTIAAFTFLPLAAQTGSAPALPKIAAEKYTLPNGLQVILHVDRKLPVVHVNQWFHVGSASERIGRSGFAHLFEHMMFQGSKNVGKYIPELEVLGAAVRGGGVNGTTNWDRTNYFATVPSPNLETLLWIEADRLATLPEALTKEKLDNQRDVVKNERRQGLENQPYGKWIKLVFENLYPNRHPYANDVIGSHTDLTAASTEDVKEFFRIYYTPNNLSLVITGDFDPAQAKTLIEKYFGGIPAGPALDQPVRWIPKLEGTRIIETTDRVPQERVFMAWPTPGFFDKGDAELDLLSTILSDGLSSRLQRKLVYDDQLCSEVTAFQMTMERGSVYIVDATARPGVPLGKVEQAINDVIRKIAEQGPTPDELERAKTKWEYTFITGLERIGGFGGKADALNRYNMFLGDPNKFEADLLRYRNTTWPGIKEAVATWIDTPNRLIVRFRPERSGRGSTVSLDRAKRPPTGQDSSFKTPAVQTSKLDNGIQIFVVERPDLPKVAVSFATRAGSVRDPAGKEGTADLLAATLRRGTRTRKALEIDDALGDLGTALNSFAARESARVEFDVLKRNLSPAFAIFADVVRNPSFPAAEFEREQKLRLDELAQQAKNPSAVAARIAPMLAFGQSHPYGRPRQGLPSTVATIAPADLTKLHADFWKPGSSALIFAGDITVAEATALAKREFGAWTGGAAPEPSIPAPAPVGTGKTYVLDRQGSAQTYVLQIMSAPIRAADDYFAFNLANSVYGSGFNTRLNLNLRENKGYSYGTNSQTELNSKFAIMRAGGGVQTDKTKESIFEFRKELTGIAGEKPITDKELADARMQRIRSFAQQFETLGSIMGQIAFLWQQQLPMTELEREPTEFAKLSLDRVNSVMKQYAAPAKTSLLLVGDWSKVQTGLQELDLGEILLVDEQGKVRTSKEGSGAQ